MKRVSQKNPYRSIAFPVVSFEQFLLMPKLIECWVRVAPEKVSAPVIQRALSVHPWTPFARLKALLDGTQLALELDRKALRDQVHNALETAGLMHEFAVHELIRSALSGDTGQATQMVDDVLMGGAGERFSSLDTTDVKNLNGLYGIGKDTSILGLKHLCESLRDKGFDSAAQVLLDSHQDRVS